MDKSTPFTFGADAIATDGACGELKRVVVNPVRRTLTHLLIEPKHRQGLGRLVPVDLVASVDKDRIKLRITMAEFEQLDFAEETGFLPGAEGDEGYKPGDVVPFPEFGGNTSVPITSVSVPVGDVTIRGGDQVHATDGDIGQIDGLAVSSGDNQVTHVMLKEGHLWGRKQVAIPMDAIASVNNGVRLKIDKRTVQDLPPADMERI